MFFSTFIALYILINAYIYFRGFSALSAEGRWVIPLKLAFIALVLSFPVMHSLEDSKYGAVFGIISVIGSFWIPAMIYFFLLIFLSDLVLLFDYFVPIIPAGLKRNRVILKRKAFFGSIAAVSLIVFFGWVNTLFIRVENIEVDLAKLPKAFNPTTVVFAADFHIGANTQVNRVKDYVDAINAQNPDIILIGGDLVEGSIDGLGSAAEALAGLRARLGVYAVLGNHEYHGGADDTEAFMRSAGIVTLRNETVTLAGLVNLVGLEDPRSMGHEENNKTSAPLFEILSKRDPLLPTILIFHRPINFEEYAASGVDLTLSGHSHHGQFFPLTLITDLVYPVSYGYERIGPMGAYVTSGIGTWGPPVRILTHPEIVKITLVNRKID